MAETKKSVVRKGRIYHIKVADIDHRAFIWTSGKGFSGRIENQPHIQVCHGRTVVVVRDLLCAALEASLNH